MNTLTRIHKAIENAGGVPYLVGGGVRDLVLGYNPKDHDTEVFNMTVAELVTVLAEFGEVNQVGVSFGVIKVRVNGDEFDFSLPRRDSKIAAGHRGFIVETDSAMTIHEAAARRDYTINAMSIAPDGSMIDPYNGMEDIKARRLRHTSTAFSEDPLRVLRGMQFAGRFDFSVCQDTAELCAELRAEYPTLARERIWGEWHKWASKSTRPSAGLEFLYSTRWVRLYPELNAMIGVQQDPEWHPEGSVWQHTKMVCDAAQAIAVRAGQSSEDRAIVVLAALLHDVGKPVTTFTNEAGRVVSPGHAEAGEEFARSFLASIGAPLAVTEDVCFLVTHHMRHIGASERTARRLAAVTDDRRQNLLAVVIEADHSGRFPLPAGMPEDAAALFASMTAARAVVAAPWVQGRDLIAAGFTPARWFGGVLQEVYRRQVDGEIGSPEQAISIAVALAPR